mgnify:CR=1 FL=1
MFKQAAPLLRFLEKTSKSGWSKAPSPTLKSNRGVATSGTNVIRHHPEEMLLQSLQCTCLRRAHSAVAADCRFFFKASQGRIWFQAFAYTRAGQRTLHKYFIQEDGWAARHLVSKDFRGRHVLSAVCLRRMFVRWQGTRGHRHRSFQGAFEVVVRGWKWRQ